LFRFDRQQDAIPEFGECEAGKLEKKRKVEKGKTAEIGTETR